MEVVGTGITMLVAMAAFVAVARSSRLSPRKRVLLMVICVLVFFAATGEECKDTNFGSSNPAYAGDKIVESAIENTGTAVSEFGKELGKGIDNAADSLGIPDSEDVRKAIGVGQ